MLFLRQEVWLPLVGFRRDELPFWIGCKEDVAHDLFEDCLDRMGLMVALLPCKPRWSRSARLGAKSRSPTAPIEWCSGARDRRAGHAGRVCIPG